MHERIQQLYQEERDKLSPLPDADTDFIALDNAWKRYRDELVKFCVWATADLHGMKEEEIDPNEFLKMSNEELEKEADWLDYLLGK